MEFLFYLILGIGMMAGVFYIFSIMTPDARDPNLNDNPLWIFIPLFILCLLAFVCFGG